MAVVLVVDDDPLVTHSLAKFIGSVGHSVLAAHNGVDAVRLALQHKPPLVFLDLDLNGVSGFDILDELRKFSRCRHTQVVMMCESADRFHRECTFRRCATGYVGKPLVLREVLQQINAFAVEEGAA